MADRKDRADAIGAMLQRIERTMAEPAAGFPHYADPVTGLWTRSPAGDWTGGFWVGELWLAEQLTGEGRYHDAAITWARRLRPRVSSETVFRGFLFWYGAAIGAILTGDEEARRIALAGAAGLADLYDPVARAIPLGSTAEEASSVGRNEANVDGVPGGTPLLAWAAANGGPASMREMAMAHAERHIELCVRDDGSVCQSALVRSPDGQPCPSIHSQGHPRSEHVDEGTGLGDARVRAGDGLRGGAVRGRRDPSRRLVARADPADGVAYWDFDAPPGPGTERDTSGTAIAAAALLKLAVRLPTAPPTTAMRPS